MASLSARGHEERGASIASSVQGPWVYDRWVQRPAQDRSERTFFRFLDAAEGLLGSRHWHEVSVQEIVREADASVGSFYNRFNDKMALLHCLDDRLGQECELTATALLAEFKAAPVLINDAPGIVISLLMRLCSERRGVIRALDLARKMSTADAFVGLGPRFERAMQAIGDMLSKRHPDLSRFDAETISHGLTETFWLARENLLYGKSEKSDAVLHQSLFRHFEASLTELGSAQAVGQKRAD